MRKIVIILLLLVSPLYASPEFWVGASFLADRNHVSDDISASFPAMGERITEIKSLGLDLDLVFFPFSNVRVGIFGGYNLLLPIGRTIAGGSNEGYITYDFDYRQDMVIGLAYYQFFTHRIGAFLTCGFDYSWYRTAIESIPNDNEPMDYIYEEEYGISGELGIISRSGNMYFRLGFGGYYDLAHEAKPGFRLSLSVGGGFIIGGK